MCYSRKLSNRIKRLKERCLRIAYSDSSSSYDEMMEKDDAVSIHHKGLQTLAIKSFETFYVVFPQLIDEVLSLKDSDLYNLRQVS